MLERVGGRKAACIITALIICVGVFLIKGNIPEGVADMLKYLVAAYLAGNVGADVVAAVVSKNETTPPPAVGVVPAPSEAVAVQEAPSAAVEGSAETLGQIANGVSACQQGISYIIGRIGSPNQ